jgi:hypothetical protein
MLSPTGEIRRDDLCLDYSSGIADVDQNGKVLIIQCHTQNRNQRWIYNEVRLNIFQWTLDDRLFAF